jgi:hypothetical protein
MIHGVTLSAGARTDTASGSNLAMTGAVLDLALAAGIGLIRSSGASAGMRHAEGPLPTVAMVVAFAAPGVAALIGIAIKRPVLFGAAAFGCGPLVIFSIAAFPMIIPFVLFFTAFAKAQTGRRRPSLLAGLILGGFAIPIVGGLWILITETSQYTYNFAGGSEGGEYFTAGHAALCIALVVADVIVASTLAWLSPDRGSAWR